MGFSTSHLLLLNKPKIFLRSKKKNKPKNHTPVHKKLKEFLKHSWHEKPKLLFFKDLNAGELSSPKNSASLSRTIFSRTHNSVQEAAKE